MAEVIHFRDGSSEAVLTDKPAFIERCIREKLGKEAADFISDYIKELLDEIERYEIALLEPERAADGYLTLCQDTLATLKELRLLVYESRINKIKIQKAVDNAYKRLQQNL